MIRFPVKGTLVLSGLSIDILCLLSYELRSPRTEIPFFLIVSVVFSILSLNVFFSYKKVIGYRKSKNKQCSGQSKKSKKKNNGQ